MRLLLAMLALVLPAGAGDHRRIDLPIGPGGRATTIHCYVFNSDVETFRVIDQGGLTSQNSTNLGAACAAINATAGVNGSYFTPEGEPLGLMIAGGKSTGSPALAGVLTSGVLWSDGPRGAIARSKQFDLAHTKAKDLLQAGPFLIENGAAVKGLEAKRFARRTIVMTDGGKQWAIAYVPGATLAGLANVLAMPGAFPHFPLKTVLNLDGGGSSGLWIRKENDQLFYLREISKVRNFLVIVRRNQG
ncbi:phosphodiester glycosidase family protein [Luteolibacter sp. GHJ8]|uniref:Phosphodiester glycosidase family protein n=1 Tax=Luteolibacter rhizosphaerae TaxID=2989719 RepID=A0ABT3G2T0_9BACT|nr:phosphodiester glycosidase family protein [Luteolibacter rhizosphaerae]MCW1913784.1 phosphodiester glycosidase family protein [Luteolibacter rhizosphaerae]